MRENAPLGLHYELITPAGKHFRWGADEPDPANVLNGARYSSTMSGGFETLDGSLPRKSGVDYSDLERLSTIIARGAGGEVAWEGRLERAPRVSGDQLAISPSAVGWQAALEDDKTTPMIYVDADISRWTEPTRQRQIDILDGTTRHIEGPEAIGDGTNPGLRLNNMGIATGGNRIRAEAWYDAGAGALIEHIYFDPEVKQTASGNHELTVGVAEDDVATGVDQTGDIYGSLTPAYFDAAAPLRYGRVVWRTTADLASGENDDRLAILRELRVYGDHGITLAGDDPGGVYASDVLAHAVGRWAPSLRFTEGPNGTIRRSDFIISHLAFSEPTTAAEIIAAANRFHLRDWAVWEDRTFHYHARGERGRKWRARVGPAKLEETGPQVDRLWESIVVSYEDGDGTTRTVGPPGSGADTESDDLKDSDPENPANKLGITRRDILSAGITTAAGATKIGQRFLEEAKALDTSGRAQLVGYVEDDRGISRPAWQVRAGDEIAFVDAASPSNRRIVKADYSTTDLTTGIDLDAPPETLDALLERLGVALASMGHGSPNQRAQYSRRRPHYGRA